MSTSKLKPYKPTEEQLSILWDQSIGRHQDQWIGHALQVADAANAHYESQLAGQAIVPQRLTGAMNRIMDSEGWDWAELLAAAEAIDVQTYDAMQEAAAPQVAEKSGLPSGWTLEEMATCYRLRNGNAVVATLAGPDAKRDADKIAFLLHSAAQPAGEAAMPVIKYQYKHINEFGHEAWSDHVPRNTAVIETMALVRQSDAKAALAALTKRYASTVQAYIDSMPPGHMAQYAAAEHPCGNPLPVAVSALVQRIAEAENRIETDGRMIAGLEADLVEERNRISDMRREHGEEAAALTAQARHAEDCLGAANARIAELEADAGRYRWLRAWGDAAYVEWKHDSCHGTELDASIDAAMKNEPSIDAAALASAAETFMHAAPEWQRGGLVTEGMVTAYLDANTAYWSRADEIQPTLGTWRAGTPREATRQSLIAALAAASTPAPRDSAAMLVEHMQLVLDYAQRYERACGGGHSAQQALYAVTASAKLMLGIAS